MSLSFDVCKCHGEINKKICPLRDTCQRFVELGKEEMQWQAAWICENGSHDSYIEVLKVKK